MKTCSKCKTTKPLEEFHKDSRKPDGRKYRCRECVRNYQAANKERIAQYRQDTREHRAAIHKEWRARTEVREKEAERKRNYYRENKKRIVSQQATYRKSNPAIINAKGARRRANKSCAVPQRWKKSDCPDNLCYWCGVDLSTVKVHLEHLMPISLGGEAKDYNEVAACPSCNLQKNNKHPLVWLAEQF